MNDSVPPKPKPRWYRLTPDRFLIALLPILGLLWLSERFLWFPFNEKMGWTVLVAVAVVGVAVVLLLLWCGISLVFRRRFQFSLRTLLLFVLVIAVACSWLGVEVRRAARQKETVEVIFNAGGFPFYERAKKKEPAEPEWLRELLGDDYFRRVTKAFLSPNTGDAELQRVAELASLEFLTVEETRVTDAGLAPLKNLTQLDKLVLSGTKVTDAGLVHLGEIPSLELLVLLRTSVTDAGLEHLTGLTNLRELDLSETKVTEEGVKKLQQALPDCEISY